MTAKRFMVDDAGTLIDMQTRDTFDYVSDVCDLLNEQHETIERLKQNINELLSVDIEKELLEENEQLRKDSTVLILANQDYRKENEQLKNICKNIINEVNKRGITVTMTDDCKELLE